MPSRIIREGWIESERIAQLDSSAERFFLRLCLRADDFGRYHANPILLRSNLFPLHEDMRSTDIPRWLAACEKAGLVRCFVADGKRFLEIPRFNQRMRAAVSRFPAPASDLLPNVCHMPVISPTDDGALRPDTEAEEEAETDIDPLAKTPEPDVAEPIYSAYPRKQNRRDAFKAIRGALKVCGYDRLLERTRAYADAVALWSEHDRQFIPHPASWFNRGGYEDDPATWVRVAPSGVHGKVSSMAGTG